MRMSPPGEIGGAWAGAVAAVTENISTEFPPAPSIPCEVTHK